jgi:hypothetical protein
MRLISSKVLSLALWTVLMSGGLKAVAQAPASLSGTWYGIFDVILPDGTTDSTSTFTPRFPRLYLVIRDSYPYCDLPHTRWNLLGVKMIASG